MPRFIIPTTRALTQDWLAEFDDWDGDGRVDYPGGFYHSIGWDGHNGLDYACQPGDPVVAAADGVVEWAGAGDLHPWLTGGGNVVMIDHGDVRTEYLHLSRVLVSNGTRVKQGQLIARSGATGAATAPHLHWGFLPAGTPDFNNRMRGRISPYPYLHQLTPQEAISMANDIKPQTFKDWIYAEQGSARSKKQLYSNVWNVNGGIANGKQISMWKRVTETGIAVARLELAVAQLTRTVAELAAKK